ncbi:DUF1990 domain-containing protein [Actinokineospora sp. NBRC 105648]|uniref:DUF1990 family protein n=1 Tax=Actinokineospora sp. NBRC 105648 TaxID=3032206 RepID=UPI0024A33F61|nr:DUF1990 domain-containing protein [Actinokineospora sp. NBRC 105648]GLZ42785.1 hypothetical protein Acsp05_64090 [Actinokineospora sp. NBRC 105648]
MRRLEPDRAARLRAAELTYPEVGRTTGDLPPGYRITHRVVRLPTTVDFDRAARDLFAWRVQLRAGLQVTASDEIVVAGAVVELGIGPLTAPCRVVHVVDEPRRRGFAYGTLPGHPECGEEAFLLDHRDDGITFTILAFSRPATALARLAGPVGHWLQDVVTGRYVRALT